ncbi:MAG: NIL domain-containing protein [Verrucomicrobium sp.]|nr:NIL domain-containing protein [Verrucomicrobium sp.]
MAQEKQRFWLTFTGVLVEKPLICLMGRKFDVIFSIRNSSVTKDVGIIALEIEGERPVIQAAVKWLESEGVQVEPVEINTIEG